MLQGHSYIIVADISVTGATQSLGLLCLSSCLETSEFSCSDSYCTQKSSRVSWKLKGSEGQKWGREFLNKNSDDDDDDDNNGDEEDKTNNNMHFK